MAKKTNISEITDFGKIPPQCIEIEESFLGILMDSCEVWYDVNLIVKPESFYNDSHQKIYDSFTKVMIESKKCDLLMLTERLRRDKILDEVGGPFYVTQLLGKSKSQSYAVDYAMIIRDKYIKRELIRYSNDIITMAFDDSSNTNDLVEYAESGIFSITKQESTKEAKHLKEHIKENIKEIKKAVNSEKHVMGIPSGLKKLDRITNGWKKGTFILIAARPGIGKSSYMLMFAKSAALHGYKPAVFSLEMPGDELSMRLLSTEVNISPIILNSGRFHKDKIGFIERKASELYSVDIYIDDTPGLNIINLRSKIKRLILKYGIGIIFIDYVQLMKVLLKYSNYNRGDEISEISRELKLISKEHDMPVVALSQLNRSIELRSGEKRPQLSDLKQSGSLEEDTDMVIFIHRPELYNIKTYQDGTDTQGTTNLIIAKHRGGAIGDIIVYNNESMTKIADNKEELDMLNTGQQPILFDAEDESLPF